MGRKLFSGSLVIPLIFCCSLALGGANDGAKALFYGETTKETVNVIKTGAGSAASSGTELGSETIQQPSKSDSGSTKKKSAGNQIPLKKTPKSKEAVAQLATGLSYWIEVLHPGGQSERCTAESRNFKSGERIRFAFKTNKNGYIYLLLIGSSGKGNVLFPDQRINNGKNIVEKQEDYLIPFGEKTFVMDATPGEERVLIFFSESEIGDINQYFASKNKVEPAETQRLYAYAEQNGSKDIVFEEDISTVKPASYIVSQSNDSRSVIFKEIKINHQ